VDPIEQASRQRQELNARRASPVHGFVERISALFL
jgi:hypothetical protein